MSKKQDLYTGRGIGQAVRDAGYETSKEGSYLYAEKDNRRVHWPDTDRTLPKPVRERVLGALVKLGILATIIGVIAAYLMSF